MPISTAEPGETKPAPGVMVARPATAPEAAPRVVGLPRCHHSMTDQVAMGQAGASFATTQEVLEKLGR